MTPCDASHMETTLSTLEPPDDSIPLVPDLKPVDGPTHGRKRSFATARVILALMLREMTSRYGRSPGGYLWAILEPIGMIAVLSFGFSLLMRSPSLGNSFMIFYASGYLVFSQYSSIEKSVTKAIPYARGLLQYPMVTWLDAIVARLILNTLTHVLNTIIILSGVIYFTPGTVMLDLGPMVAAMTAAVTLGLGIGTMNAFLHGMFPLLKTIWGIITRPLMIASAVLYIMEDLPETAANILWYNPVAHLTGLMRTGVFPTYAPEYINLAYVFGIALVTLAIGLIFLRRHASTIISDD